jgi:Rieske Fe-S protein
VAAAVRFERQAEFHPRKYLHALTERAEAAGVRVFERSRAVEVSAHEGRRRVKCPSGRVSAGRVVVATHYPFLDRSLAFARLHVERSYAITCRIAGAPPDGMHISGDTPTRSVRAVPLPGADEELLLVGGEGHKTGTVSDTELRYERLEAFARQHWDVVSVEHRWSAQDPITADLLPYVGALTPRDDRVLMATGFAKWGMTGGTAAALLLSDLALGRPAPSADLFDPWRVTPLASARSIAKENAQVAAHFVGDRVRHADPRAPRDLRPGQGAIVEHGGKRAAAHRDDAGALHLVSARCTHLGCLVAWNAAERSWDCPCHGSRFAPDGSVLEGPAVHRLESVPLGPEGS